MLVQDDATESWVLAIMHENDPAKIIAPEHLATVVRAQWTGHALT